MEPDHPHSRLIAMSDEEKLELAVALAKREDRYDLGLARLREQYPAAPDALLRSGAFHLYSELAGSFLTVLAHLELNLRDREHEISQALVSDPTYHLYNWLQLETVLPWAKRDFFSELLELKECLSDGDTESARELVEKVLEQLEGTGSAPLPDFP
jgi:hypothetical protein